MRRIFKNITLILMIMAAFMLNVSCPQNGNINSFFAIGVTVDQEAPKVMEITSHKNGDYMAKGDFTLSGIYEDNIGVTRVITKLTVQGSKEYLAKEVQYDPKQSGQWSVTFSETDMNKLNIFEGGKKVTFTATAYDAMNNSTPTSVFLYVDLEPPTIEWQKPEKTTRFTNDVKDMYKTEPIKFNNLYKMTDSANIAYYHNGTITVSGFSSDNFGIKSTYLQFYDENNILVAVTDVIDTDDGICTAPDLTDSSATTVKRIGNVIDGATAMSWKYSIDTTELTPTKGMFRVEIITYDEAGGKSSSRNASNIREHWLMICQDADIPQNVFNTSGTETNPATINWGELVSGYSFDDDAVKMVAVAVVQNDPALIKALTDTEPKEWTPVKTDTKIVSIISALDETNGISVLNWSAKLTLKGGTYAVFVVPYDINDKYWTKGERYSNENYYDKPMYKTFVKVASEDDPVIKVDNAFRGATIIGKNDTTITGYFYDNEAVTEIKAMMADVESQDTSVEDTSSDWVSLYTNTSGNEFLIDGFNLDSTKDETLSTGQKVVKYFFSYNFKPEIYSYKDKNKEIHKYDFKYKSFKLMFNICDNENRENNDSVTIYGDSMPPRFEEGTVSPETNQPLITATTFEGWVSDNVGIEEVMITASSVIGFPADKDYTNIYIKSTLEKDETESKGYYQLGDEVIDDTDPKNIRYKRYFSVVITPENTESKETEIVLTVKDTNGLTKDKVIFIKADDVPPKIDISSPSVNDLLLGDVTFDGFVYDNFEVVRLTVASEEFDVSEDISACLSDNTNDRVEDGTYKDLYRKTFSYKFPKTFDGSKAATITFKAYDKANNEKEKTFTVKEDYEQPQLRIVSPKSNAILFGDVTFDGFVYDNVEVVSLAVQSSEFDDLSADWSAYLRNEEAEEDGTYKGLNRKSFSVVVSGFDGSKAASITFTVTDNAGNTRDAVLNVSADTTLPTIVLNTPTNNTVVYGDVTFDGYVEDNFEVISLKVKSTAWDVTEDWTEFLSDNEYNDASKNYRKTFAKKINGFTGAEDVEIVFTASDKTGNVKVYSFKAIEDTVLPQFDKTSLSPNTANIEILSDVTFDGIVNDNIGVESLVLQCVNGSGEKVFNDVTVDLTPIDDADGKKRYTYSQKVEYDKIKAEKSIELKFIVTDVCGNVNTYSYYVKDDSIPPTFVSINPENNTAITIDDIHIGGTVADNVDVIEVSVVVKVSDVTVDRYVFKKDNDSSKQELPLGDSSYKPETKKYERTFEAAACKLTPSKVNYKDAEIIITAKDGSFNETSKTIIIKGDNAAPTFENITPANNTVINENTNITGYIADNLDVVALVIKNNTNSTILGTFKVSPGNDEIALGDKAESPKKYSRSFTLPITPELLNYSDAEIELTATDIAGNTNTKIIYLKGDTTKPSVVISGIESGSYAKKGKTFIVDVTHDLRDIQTIDVYVNGVKQDDIVFDDGDKVNGSAKHYRKTLTIDEADAAPGSSTLNLDDGDVTIKVTATDVGSNTGDGSVYFVVDNTPPSGMEITIPTLLSKTDIDELETEVENISMEEITYYLNNNVTFKGIGTDNYKVAETVVNIFEKGDSEPKYAVTIGLNGAWKSRVLANDQTWDGVRTAPNGVPSNYSFVLDTTKLADGNYYLSVTSTDAADNSADGLGSEAKAYFKVMQDADKPRVTIYVDDGDTVMPPFTFTGVAFDDDGFDSTKPVKYVLDNTATHDETYIKNNGFDFATKNANTFSFSKTTPSEDGTYYLHVLPIDKNDRTGDVKTVKVIASSSDTPTVTNVEILQNGGTKYEDILAGRIKVTATATSNNDSKYITKMLYRMYTSSYGKKETETEFTGTFADDDKGGWYYVNFAGNSKDETKEIPFDSSEFVADKGQLTVEVKVEVDGSTRSSAVRQSIMIDNEAPTVTISTPNEDATIDGMTTFSGTVKELGSSIKNMYISYHERDEWTDEQINEITASYFTNENTVAKGGNATVDMWLELGSFTTTWTHEYNSTVLTDETHREIVIAAVDQLDNVTVERIKVYVSQDNDRPILTITNMDLSEKAGDGSIYLPNIQGKIICSVEDDDGVIDSVWYGSDEYALDSNSWGSPIAQRTTYFTIDTTKLSIPDGPHSIFFKIKDAKGTEFVSKFNPTDRSAAIRAIKLIDNNDNAFGNQNELAAPLNNTSLRVMFDTADPVIGDGITYSLDGVNYDQSVSTLANVTFGATYKTLYLKFPASDDNGIKKGEWKIGNGDDWEDATDDNNGSYIVIKDLSELDSDTYTLTLRATDNVDKTTTKSLTVKVDTKQPTVAINSPAANTTVNKVITVSGSVSNIGPTGIKQIYIGYLADAGSLAGLTEADITSNLSNAAAYGYWTKIDGGASWTCQYNTEIITTAVDNVNKVASGYVIAVAVVCNNGFVATQTKTVNIDQDSDRPILTISNMDLTEKKTSTDYIVNESGVISGSVNDDDGVSSIDYSLDFGANWTNISTNSTFTIDTISDGPITIYFKVRDIAGGEFESKVTGDQFSAIKLRDNKGTVFGLKNSTENMANTVLYTRLDTASPVYNTDSTVSGVRQVWYSTDKDTWSAESGIESENFGKNNTTGGKLYIKFNASDANDIAKAQYKLGTGSLTNAVLTAGAYICEIDLTSVESGTKALELYIEDNAGKSNTLRYYVTIDNDAPVLTIGSPAGSEVVDKTIQISGTANDASSGLKGVYVSYFRDALTAEQQTAEYITNAEHQGASLGKWNPIGTAGSWSSTFNTMIINDNTTDYQFTVAAIDNNNNVAIRIQSIHIDQDQDRPIVRFSNLLLDNMSSGNRAWHISNTIIGQIEDYDGVQSAQISTNGEDWSDLSLQGTSFAWNVGELQGDAELYFKITDKGSTTYTSSTATTYSISTPKIIDSTGSNLYGYRAGTVNLVSYLTTLYLTIDTKPVVIDNVTYHHKSDFTDTTTDINTQTFGGNGDYRYFYIKFSATDDNGVASVDGYQPRVTFDNTDYVCTNITDTDYYYATIDMNGKTSSSAGRTFIIKAKDVAAQKSGADWQTKEGNVKIDNTDPIVTFTNPSAGTQLYGTVAGNEIRGDISDISSLGSFKYWIVNETTGTRTAESDNIISYIGKDAANWYLVFDNGAQENDKNTYHLPLFTGLLDVTGDRLLDPSTDDIQPVSIHVKTADALGNTNASSVSRLFNIEVNADKPEATIAYPEYVEPVDEDTKYSTVGGNIRINGSSSVKQGSVDAVYLQIYPNYDPLGSDNFDDWKTTLEAFEPEVDDVTIDEIYTIEKIGTTSEYGIRTTGSVSNWALFINTYKEFNKSGTPRMMGIRAVAISASGKINKSRIVTFKIDASIPRYGDHTPLTLKNSDKTKIMSYVSGGDMWLSTKSDSWTLYGSVWDDNGIKELYYIPTVNGVSKTRVNLVSNSSVADSGKVEAGDTVEGQTVYELKVPLSSYMTGSSGTVSLEFTATEAGDGGKAASTTITLNYDKAAPTVTTKLNNSDNEIADSLSSKLWLVSGNYSEPDGESGFGKVVLFLTRTKGGVNYVVDPMFSSTTTGNANLIPQSGLVDKDGMLTKEMSGTISGGTQLLIGTDPQSAFIKVGGLVLIKGVYYRITSVKTTPSNGKYTIGIDGSVDDGDYTVNFVMAQVIDTQLRGQETGSWLDAYSYSSDDPTTGGDGDHMLESFYKDNGWVWDASLNTDNIYDGPITVNVLGFDKAGNISTPKSYSGVVRNNPPRIVGISYGTDKNSDGSIVDDELNTKYSLMYKKDPSKNNNHANGRDNQGDYGDIVKQMTIADVFTIKDKIVFYPEIVGGNGGLQWSLFYVDSSDTTNPKDLVDPKDVTGDINSAHSSGDAIRDKITLNIPLLKLLEALKYVEGGKTKYKESGHLVLRIYDKTDSNLENCNFVTYKIAFSSSLTSDSDPGLIFKPLYWNSKTDHSVYPNNSETLQGHIDLKGDLPDTVFDKSTGEYDDDDKVSGKITFIGEATDDNYISAVYAAVRESDTIHNSNLNNIGDVTIDTFDDMQYKYFLIAERNAVTGHLVSQGVAFDANNWACDVTDDYLEDGSHKVSWKFNWNSESVSTVAAKDVNIFFYVTNRGGASITDAGVKYTSKSASRTRRVDVVPYITKLYTGISDSAGEEFARSATGGYSVRENETVRMYGYNLKTGTNAVAIGSTSVTPTAGGTDEGGSYIRFNVGTAVSGSVSITVNDVVSLNNSNANPTFASATDNTITANEYNSQANGKTSDRFDDDVRLIVWNMGYWLNETNITSPMLKLDNSSNYYMSYGYGVPRMYVNKNGDTQSVDGSYNKFHNTNVIYDDNGNIYAIATNTDRVSDSSAKFVFYTPYTTNNYNQMPTEITAVNGEYQTARDSKRHLETVYNSSTGVYDINRVKNPKITSYTNGVTTYIAMAYYDYNNTINPVKVRFGSRNGRTLNGGIAGHISGTAQSNNPSTTDGSYKNYHIIASDNTTKKGGAYASVGIVPNGGSPIAVVAWYDAGTKRLAYSWNNTNLMSPTTASTATWQTNSKYIDSSYTGWHTDMCVDSDGGIHIAYYNSAKGDLKYAYASSYNGAFSTVTVDSYLSVGTNITINVRKEGGKQIPYIYYYNASASQTPNSIKVAWLKDADDLRDGAKNDLFTGAWESMIIPTTNIPVEATVCGGVPTSGTYADTVALGYMTDVYYERAYIKK